MPDTKQLIQEFNQSKVGRIINGRESFRNRVGQYLHGATQHKAISTIASVVVLTSAVALAGPVVGFVGSIPLWLPGAVSAVTAFGAPKKQEKAAADFLMNVAVRKSAALNNYLLKQGYDEVARTQAVDAYLRDQSPKFGYYKGYQAENPNAAEQIVRVGMKGDLPLCHSPELYQAEVLQEMLTQEHQKGGIMRGLWDTITLKNIRREKQAQQIAAQRWADRQSWLADSSADKGTWRSFYKDKAFHSQKQTSSPVPQRSSPNGISAYLKANGNRTQLASHEPAPKKINQINPEFLRNRYGKSA